MASVLSNPRVELKFTADVTSGGFVGNINHAPTAHTPAVGTNAGNVQFAYHADLTLDSAAPLDLDLTALPDPTGANKNYSKITHIFGENLELSVAGRDMTLGGATANAFVAAIPLAAMSGGTISSRIAFDNPLGWTVDGTHKILRVSLLAGTASARLTIFGR